MCMTRIAVLMTCHNRKETTVSCLDTLTNQEVTDNIRLKVYLVDAGSTDGTARAIQERFPDVHIISRDCSLYWCGGTRVAFGEAMKEDYDYYLWLNDDTMLFPDAISALLRTATQIKAQDGRVGIVVGSTCDPDTGKPTYGGRVRVNRWRPLALRSVEPSDEPLPCDTMNGNCVLIPREVAQLVGNLSADFTHSMGDVDYGLRARAKGISLWVAPGYVGECRRNRPNQWAASDTPFEERLKLLRSPKGMPPREWVAYAKRHAGIQWPLYWVQLHMRVFFPGLWKWLGK